MSALAQTLLDDNGARALAQLAEGVATHLVSDLHSESDVLDVFSALHKLLARSLNHVATAWNKKHDRLRVMPPEIQECCFSPLPIAQKCRLSLVCSHWRYKTMSMPSIWTGLDVHRKTANLDALLWRSGQLPVDLTFAQPWTRPFGDLDRFMQSASPRLRKLTLGLIGAQTHDLSFLHPAPRLEELSLSDQEHGSCLVLPPTIFAQVAPRLRSIHLSRVELPPSCSAFANVTSVTLHRCRGSLTRLLAAVPLIKSLDIQSYRDSVHLKSIPARSSFAAVDGQPESELTVEGLTLDTFIRLLTTLDSLTITERVDAGIMRYAAQHFTTPASTLRYGADGGLEFITEFSGCRARFCAPSMELSDSLINLTRGGNEFETVEWFELPASFCGYSRKEPPLGKWDSVSLPSLRTLVIRSTDAYGDPFLILRPGVLRGRIFLPLLTKIEITKSRDSPAAGVDVDDLVHFITEVLSVDNRSALELCVDSSAGLRLKGKADRLRSLVGTIVS